MNFSEQQLINWSRPVSTTEDLKCQNAISQITAALRAKFGNRVTIFLQGSYRNNTNVRQNSDVDIVMRYDDAFYSDLQRLSESDKAIYNAQRVSAGYNFDELKADTEEALRNVFTTSVERKNKCIQVNGNSNRITADVIPCFVLKRFSTLQSVEAEGIKFYSDDNKEIISFPEQHYSNGTEKTNQTYRLYKRMVRILKVVNYRLIDEGEISDDLVSSFFIECLVYNVPNNQFISENYTQTLRNVIVKIYQDMENNADYTEVNKLLWLFSNRSPRTRQNALVFMQKCWNYLGYQ
ncbi:nucleotidyltransferase domain-containing protein [Sphingobacterium spiritivorum]|uniref:nucleotidyltransferase domain-containing protein n=1 Tax=Sphingobacterium spiritivorum TaxID=258 RepID=UPI003DA4D2D9